KSAHDAFELFDRAAAKGYAPGMISLGRAYSRGNGVKRDEVRGYALLTAAVQIGVRQSERDVALFELGALSQRLNPEQLGRAQADARTLIEAQPKTAAAADTEARSAYRL